MRFILTATQSRGFSIGASLVLVTGEDWEFLFVLMILNRTIKIGVAKF